MHFASWAGRKEKRRWIILPTISSGSSMNARFRRRQNVVLNLENVVFHILHNYKNYIPTTFLKALKPLYFKENYNNYKNYIEVNLKQKLGRLGKYTISPNSPNLPDSCMSYRRHVVFVVFVVLIVKGGMHGHEHGAFEAASSAHMG